MKESNDILNIERESNKKYYCLNVNEGDEILEFEINMIQNNPSLTFLNIELRQINNFKKIYFSLGNKLSLEEYLQKSIFNISDILNIVEGILNTLVSMKEFMLDNRKVLLNSNYIFIEKSSLIAYLIYLPINIDKDYDIEDEFVELCKIIFKDIRKYKFELTSIEKKLVSSLTNNKSSFEKINHLFTIYRNNKNNAILKETKDEEYESKTKVEIDESIIEEFIKDIDEPKKVEKNKKITYQSVIEEDYKEFDDFDEDFDDEEDEDTEYEEYKEIKKYQKTLESKNKTKSLLGTQLIVVLLIGSFGLILSKDDKGIFYVILVVLIILIIIFTVIVFGNNSNKEK